ncbi:MAG: hypothetical protein HN842_05395 [Gammaproteobacteria bacterium]|nr:hypothetical protein [Gammaproteobacteria bacterium]MBT7307631.1 hypothetical protein [Gammaproteobacteria bacterium]
MVTFASGLGLSSSIKGGVAAAATVAATSPLIILGIAAATGAAAWRATKLKQQERPENHRLHYRVSSAVQPMI